MALLRLVVVECLVECCVEVGGGNAGMLLGMLLIERVAHHGSRVVGLVALVDAALPGEGAFVFCLLAHVHEV